MKFLVLVSLPVLLFAMGCKKVYPTVTNVINHDTTIVIHNDTTIIYDTTIISNYDTTIFASANQYRYQLPDFNTGDTLFLTGETYSLQRFNIDYFPGVDSVFYTFGAGSINPVNDPKGVPFDIELYDITDNIAIAGSLINVSGTSNYAPTIYFQSGNFAGSLPHKEITLGIRSRFRQSGSRISVINPVIWLYKKQH